MAKRAVITGVTGQDGAYLSRLLLEKGYQVWGACRRSSTRSLWRLDELAIGRQAGFRLVDYDLTDPGSALDLLSVAKPDEIYNLAAQSFVGTSFAQPVTTAQITAVGTLQLLEAMRRVCPEARFYQASTSEMFGKVRETPQTEATPFHPRSPYGVSKLFAHWSTVNYRESYDLFATSGILFNHESPLRGIEFVTRKISDAVARIHLGQADIVELGNLDAQRDWGYAADYVEGMWRMLQAQRPDTYVLATGRSASVRRFVELAFQATGVDIEWRGSGVEECGYGPQGNCLVRVAAEYFRPAEVDFLLGDAGKARQELGWEADTSLESLCEMMVEADLARCSGAPSRHS